MVFGDVLLIFAFFWIVAGFFSIIWGNKQELKHNPKPSVLHWSEGITYFAMSLWPLGLYFFACDYKDTICTQCGNKLIPRAKFCAKCGQKKP